ncbi:MAG: hypothetical protein QOH17_465 [Pseudonocardiales bacterium]|nr:hypothetical protein [Pseudonocardiales bacterium]
MTLHRRILVTVAAVGSVLGLLLALATPALAATDAYVRLAHLSPDTPNVDVYVSSVADPKDSFVVPGVGYGAVSPYRALAPGSYVVSMRGAGAAADSPPVISATVDAKAGQAYTVAGTGLSASLGLTVLTDQLDLPPAGKAAVRCINGAVSASSVDLGQAGKQPWATGVKFATTTPYTDVSLGTWTLHVSAPGKPAVDLPVTIDANSTYSVVLLDKKGAFTAQLIRDSAGSQVVPVGGVETGFGGTAPSDPVALLAFGTAAVALGGVFALTLVAGVRRARSR